MITEIAGTTSRGASLPLSRSLQRRHSLPNGRAVVGALLLLVAGIGSFALAHRQGAVTRTSYAVLVHAVAPGARLAAGDLELRPMALDPSVAANAYTDTGRLTGAVALGPLAAGDLVQRSEIAPPSTVDGAAVGPSHELTIPVPSDRMPAGLRRGESIAVLATYGNSADARTLVTVQHAIVLGVSDPGDGLASRGTTRLTLSLADPTDVIETAHAAHVAELTIVRATLATSDLPSSYSVPSAKASTGVGGTAATGATGTSTTSRTAS